MDTLCISSPTQRHRTSRGLRTAGLLCAVAAVGGLVTGCGSEDADSGSRKTSGSAPTASAAAAAAAPSQSAGVVESASASPGEFTDDQAERKAIVPKVKVPYDKALKAATDAVPGTKPVSIELEGTANGTPWWDAEVAKTDGSTFTVHVDAVSGKADKPRADADEDADDKRQLADLLGKAEVTPQQAAEVATDRTKGTVSSVELDDTDQGATIWSVDVISPKDWNKTTYDIDATSKKVLKEEVDRD
ncbi:PepSY domain-containing protein [Streptomyces sp. NPDC001890]|uniref:PepSY domain-containing protein n=1 Tax=Streptomyces sp. NPDC001890 TaxID=3364620 RepID=UPI0036B6638D